MSDYIKKNKSRGNSTASLSWGTGGRWDVDKVVVVGVDASGGGGDKNKEAEQDNKQEQLNRRTVSVESGWILFLKQGRTIYI